MDTKSIYSENNIIKALLHFAIPGILSILIAELYNMVDTFFVGKYVGANSIGALSVVFPLQRLVIAISICLGIGVSNLISRRLGEKRSKEITKYTTAVTGLTLIIIFLVTTISLLFIKNICMFLGARDEILIYSVGYLRIVMFGSVFLAFTTVFGYMNIAYGNMKVMLFSSSIGAFINIVIDFVLVKHFNMGVEGVAIATVFSQIISFVFAFFYIKKLQRENGFSLIPRFDIKISCNILAIGFSSFIIEFSDAILISVLNHLLLPVGGNDAIILVGVVTKVSMFMFVAMIGVSSSIQPLISYNYGAKNFFKMKKIIKTGFVLVFSLSTIIWIFMIYNVKFVINLFLKDERLLEIATKSFKYVILVFPILSFYYICIYFFQSIGKERYNFLLSIYRETLLYIPIVIIMVGEFGVLGAWISYPIVDAISAVTGFILLFRTLRKIEA
ncbi:MATE family efflux transporter [uncultured Parvimonas sp.]|uniref:MATE family efflux transporter n=1 Tax=uncultured Parvimonas sp. TaxID=747372 RepID=UPI002596BF49|nr:MATE family efflux transporter [uncultured Parvimonas sp.]